MDELSFVDARAWSRHVFGTYLVGDSRWGAGGLFLGVAVGSRADAVEWGRSVIPSRVRNRGVTTEPAPKIRRTERTSTGECETLESDRPARTRETSGGPDRNSLDV